jgi:hypothetical protein
MSAEKVEHSGKKAESADDFQPTLAKKQSTLGKKPRCLPKK